MPGRPASPSQGRLRGYRAAVTGQDRTGNSWWLGLRRTGAHRRSVEGGKRHGTSSWARLSASVLSSLVIIAGDSRQRPPAPLQLILAPGPGSSPAVAGIPITATEVSRPKPVHAPGSRPATPAVAGLLPIEGVVTEVGTGVTLSDIWVEADSTTSGNVYYLGTTAADGSYTLSGLPADTYVVFFGDLTGVHFNGFYSGGGVPVTASAAVF